jgi:DNA repair protein RadD
MKYTLRPYQQEAVDAAMAHIRSTISSCVIILPTGAGKSMVVAELAARIYEMSKKRVLCIAPTGELVTQNRSKYLLTGEPASMFSAKAGPKNLRHPVVFGSPVTIKNSIEMFGDKYGAVIIDECDGITPTIKFIIDEMRRRNPKLRIIGMTATPYRLGTGYIYKEHYIDGPTDEETAIDPYYDKVVYELEAKFLIDNGYLTPPVTEHVEEEYDTSGLEKDRLGRYTAASVERAMVGKGRKTSRIVEDIVRRSANRRGTMIFASTKKHAMEIMESLPPGSYSYVFGDMSTAERNKAISDFKAQKFKYIVNQNILTVGVDVPHCDHIAVMRATESPRLYQQIIGRGTRLYEGKDNFLVSDYAGNIERHFAETGDLFTPEIKATRKKPSVPMDVKCPSCGFVNEFGVRQNPEGLEIDDEGYWLDLAGDRIMVDIYDKSGEKKGQKPMPGHFGRRCKNYIMVGALREMRRCTYKWSFKECPDCGFENDIAARNCVSCKAEIIDPNQKLQEEAARLDSAPDATKQSKVTMMSITRHYVSSGDDMLVVKFAIEQSPWFVNKFFKPMAEKTWQRREWEDFSIKSFGEVLEIDEALSRREDATHPTAIMFRKDKGSKYYNVKGMYWCEL